MSSGYSHFRGGSGRQETGRRVSGKTIMTQALLHSRNGARGIELARGLGQVDGATVLKALADEKALSAKIGELSHTNPEKEKRLKRAERVDRIADPMLMVPIAGLAGLCCFLSPVAGIVVAMASPIVLLSASIWASRVKLKEGSPDEKGLERAKKELAGAQEARLELCAKTGLSERLVGLLQALPLDASQKNTVLKQAIFQDSPEGYVERVAGILGGVAARGEDLEEFAGRKLECLSRDISQADALGNAAGRKADSGDCAEACALYVQAAEILERACDYAHAAGMYRSASDEVLADRRKAAGLCAKSAECSLKAGEKAAAKEAYEWAAMVVRESDPGLSSEMEGRAAALL